MFEIFNKFRAEDDGAVTVDWVVLTAAIIGLSIAVIAVIADGALDHSTGVGAALNNRDIPNYE
ncbi:MAG: hypothetical protein ACSHW1_20305 [Yoonia sp.]|uniref:hypothetical protein n=1 Tax=Yoonia sp. TaxID=2212373 RepID=UPI003EF987EB